MFQFKAVLCMCAATRDRVYDNEIHAYTYTYIAEWLVGWMNK